jgi:hypothetical protein
MTPVKQLIEPQTTAYVRSATPAKPEGCCGCSGSEAGSQTGVVSTGMSARR